MLIQGYLLSCGERLRSGEEPWDQQLCDSSGEPCTQCLCCLYNGWLGTCVEVWSFCFLSHFCCITIVDCRWIVNILHFLIQNTLRCPSRRRFSARDMKGQIVLRLPLQACRRPVVLYHKLPLCNMPTWSSSVWMNERPRIRLICSLDMRIANCGHPFSVDSPRIVGISLVDVFIVHTICEFSQTRGL